MRRHDIERALADWRQAERRCPDAPADRERLLALERARETFHALAAEHMEQLVDEDQAAERRRPWQATERESYAWPTSTSRQHGAGQRGDVRGA